VFRALGARQRFAQALLQFRDERRAQRTFEPKGQQLALGQLELLRSRDKRATQAVVVIHQIDLS
jgi:hypothetical protein